MTRPNDAIARAKSGAIIPDDLVELTDYIGELENAQAANQTAIVETQQALVNELKTQVTQLEAILAATKKRFWRK